jgi:hypothetical protein
VVWTTHLDALAPRGGGDLRGDSMQGVPVAAAEVVAETNGCFQNGGICWKWKIENGKECHGKDEVSRRPPTVQVQCEGSRITHHMLAIRSLSLTSSFATCTKSCPEIGQAESEERRQRPVGHTSGG